ncbi:MAG: CoA-binding protein [bacterium]
MKQDILKLLDEPETTIAVIGATDDRSKFGNVIYRDLKSKGYSVYPVNPNRTTVDGDTAYKSVINLPGEPTIVNFVIHPSDTLKVLRQCFENGLMNVFVQPGAEDPEVLAFLQEHGFNYVANDCIMVQTRKKM